MTEITEKILESITNEQLISALGLVTPNGRPHCTPVWVHHYGDKLFIFSKSNRAKIKYAKMNPECMIAFDLASLRGTMKLYEKGSQVYESVKDIPDKRYGHNPQLDSYKLNWDVVIEISPTKLYR